ncbi:MAG TPA: 3-deoxy-D-manno-octulosonic acid transferase, partial [Planctomycetota bacterium]|nr:3-deoxy-D-manno-octulosonic acid transferase [Planctomycetota bacterium]
RARWLAYLRDVPARFGRREERQGDRPCVWIHGVSVGEVKAAARLVESIEARVPGVEIVVSATTDTGRRVALDRYPGRRVEFWPPDLSWVVRPALDRLRPDLLVLVESEFWPNFMFEVFERGIPAALVNGRISARSAARFRRFGPLGRRLLGGLQLVCAQVPVYAERFLALGVPPDRVVVTGNLKLDNVPIVAERARSEAYARLLGDSASPRRPLLVAGSTHPPEERLVAEMIRRLDAEGTPVRAVVAPRHPGRADDVEADLARSGRPVVRRTRLSADRPAPPDAVVLLDTVGELESVYALADVVFVGGSLVKHGGQNMMEPASLAKPVVVGPWTWNFRGELELLTAGGGVAVADGAEGVLEVIRGWLRDPAAARAVGERGRRSIVDSKGATERTLAILAPLLDALPRPGTRPAAQNARRDDARRAPTGGTAGSS